MDNIVEQKLRSMFSSIPFKNLKYEVGDSTILLKDLGLKKQKTFDMQEDVKQTLFEIRQFIDSHYKFMLVYNGKKFRLKRVYKKQLELNDKVFVDISRAFEDYLRDEILEASILNAGWTTTLELPYIRKFKKDLFSIENSDVENKSYRAN